MEPVHVVKRELDKLNQMGWVLSWAKGNQRGFRVNPNFWVIAGVEIFPRQNPNSYFFPQNFNYKYLWRNFSKEEKPGKPVRRNYLPNREWFETEKARNPSLEKKEIETLLDGQGMNGLNISRRKTKVKKNPQIDE
jgi:hypothetical protein